MSDQHNRQTIPLESQKEEALDEFAELKITAEPEKKSRTPLIIVLLLILFICCCVAFVALSYLAWIFGDTVLERIGLLLTHLLI